MNKIISSITIAMLALGSSMLATATETIEVEHVQGKASLPMSPKRVVVLDYGMLDTMLTLGVEAEVALAKSNMPAYLAKYQDEKYPDLGTLKEFNIETINAFKPDCILLSTRQSAFYEELSKIAPCYVVNRTSEDQMASAKADIALVGQIFGKETEAAAAIAKIDAAIARTQAKAKASEKRALIILTNDGKISAYGSGSRFGMVHDALNVWQADMNIAVATHGQQVNYEYLAMTNPDILYVIDRSVAIGQPTKSTKIKGNALVGRTKAAQNDCIIMLDPALWYLVGGGAHSTLTMIEEIEKGLDAASK